MNKENKDVIAIIGVLGLLFFFICNLLFTKWIFQYMIDY